MNSSLLEILCCPETRQPLQNVDATAIDLLNKRISAGEVKNRAGKPVTQPVEGALIRADKKFLYPIRHGIPVMLIDEAVPSGD
jgi:uncharacterized protein YbaR (Trm112 family)